MDLDQAQALLITAAQDSLGENWFDRQIGRRLAVKGFGREWQGFAHQETKPAPPSCHSGQQESQLFLRAIAQQMAP
jgi:hypothetical protein